MSKYLIQVHGKFLSKVLHEESPKSYEDCHEPLFSLSTYYSRYGVVMYNNAARSKFLMLTEMQTLILIILHSCTQNLNPLNNLLHVDLLIVEYSIHSQ